MKSKNFNAVSEQKANVLIEIPSPEQKHLWAGFQAKDNVAVIVTARTLTAIPSWRSHSPCS